MIRSKLRPFLMGFLVIGGLANFLSYAAYADVILDPNFEGTVMVTFPTGETQVFSTGEPLPTIPSKSVVEVLEGQVAFTAGPDDKVEFHCLGAEGVASGGTSVSLACGADSGIVKILQGSSKLVNPEGKEVNLSEGQEYPIQPGKPVEAPPTAAGEPTGATALPNEPPVDSRSIESSPSQ